MRHWFLWTMEVVMYIVQWLVMGLIAAAAVIGASAVILPWVDTLSF